MGIVEVADNLTWARGWHVDYLPISFKDFHAELETTSGPVFADIVSSIAGATSGSRKANLGDGVMCAIDRQPKDFIEFAEAAATTSKMVKAA